jgi:hypothetical protein
MSARGRPVAGAGVDYRLSHQKMSNNSLPKISSRDMAPTSLPAVTTNGLSPAHPTGCRRGAVRPFRSPRLLPSLIC